MATGRTHFVQFEATPGRDNAAFADTAGAIVNCWIREDSLESAIEVARAEIESAGWIVGDPDTARVTGRQDYEGDDTGLEYFDQAQVDGMVFVFHCYPSDEEEEG